MSSSSSAWGSALIDCFVGDRDPKLRRVVPEPVTSDEAWPIAPVEMRHTARVRVVLDFLRDLFVENALPLARSPPAAGLG